MTYCFSGTTDSLKELIPKKKSVKGSWKTFLSVAEYENGLWIPHVFKNSCLFYKLIQRDNFSESVALSVVHLSPLGSQLSFSNSATRIENITDWEVITKKYRALIGELSDSGQSQGENGDQATTSANSEATIPVNQS